MRKLTFSEWIAVAAAVVVVSYFFFFNGGLFGLAKGFDPVTNTQTAAPTQNKVVAEPVQKPVVASTTPVPSTNNTSIMSNNTFTLPGIQVTDVKVGTGEEAVAGKTVVVNYTGRFTNGTVFDSSIPRGQPFDFVLGGGMVIKGWDEGVAGMKVGGQRTLVISPEKAYGPNDYGPIPGNSTLIFDVELLDVQD